ncbi:MAG: protein translocase SEC61 complex subunit gamma [Candidatus Hodarchaeota archaeon]
MSTGSGGILSRSWRMLKIAKKPDRGEVWLVTKVTAAGMLFVGIIGYIIRIAFTMLSDAILT